MAKAISLVMLETYHRLGLWHIYQNALKILIIYLRAKKPSMLILEVAYMMVSMKREFISAWENMLEKYDLQENEWLQDLFKCEKSGLWCMGEIPFL